MPEVAHQSRQLHNQYKANSTRIGAGFEEAQHSRFQVLADKMQVRFMNSSCEIDHDIIKRFCERILPVTFLSWMCKP